MAKNNNLVIKWKKIRMEIVVKNRMKIFTCKF